ncbi:3,4-dihydroxy-2-butanone-4-phosphate synthase [Cucumibacter marinus]|uniref:3,4-dihydroxy-2-butanone-4-phosphate synthase n=1 Tax=Cucumibacter marinus TaxID=1121252 RepID=UPI00048D2536|nr:3,4-dihydroxy-2-butanone-4-phosphate synthase [Cucumibacter marinus]
MTEDQKRDAAVQAAIAAIAAGEMVVVTDDDDRENEGDLVMAASAATAQKMAFIIRHTCGIVCAPLTAERARDLHLDPMVAQNDAPLSTAFTVSVDFRHGTTTGISADDRTATVRALTNDNVGAADFARPGHIFPLVARRGGVLMRSGHTEAAVDLCRMAELPEVGVICELVNDDGTVKRGPDVKAFAEEHNLRYVSVSDMIAYRQRREKLVERVGSFPMQTVVGKAVAHAYSTPFDRVQHLAVVIGDIGGSDPVPVRLQRENIVEDVFGKRQSLDGALKEIAEAGRGVLVYLREGTAGVSEHGDNARPAYEGHDSAKAREEEWREIGLGAQILKDVGVRRIHLLASRSRHYVGLSGFGIEIADTEIFDRD